MKYLRISLLFLLGAAACISPEPQKEFTGDRQFRTTDPSRLYFNNIRSTAYYRERKGNTRIDLYRNRKLSFVNTRPILHPIIVNNWMKDEAYLFIEKNDYRYGWSDTLTVEWAHNDSIGGYYTLPLGTRPAMYAFAGRIYDGLQRGQSLRVKNREGKYVPILQNLTDKNAFQTVMRDYYRLTEVY